MISLALKNYNKQKQMYYFILLFNSSTTDFTVTGSGTLIPCNKMLKRFSAILAMYDVLQPNIN